MFTCGIWGVGVLALVFIWTLGLRVGGQVKIWSGTNLNFGVVHRAFFIITFGFL